jgi:hypothetical protein
MPLKSGLGKGPRGRGPTVALKRIRRLEPPWREARALQPAKDLDRIDRDIAHENLGLADDLTTLHVKP